jgi:hypothetical protein
MKAIPRKITIFQKCFDERLLNRTSAATPRVSEIRCRVSLLQNDEDSIVERVE